MAIAFCTYSALLGNGTMVKPSNIITGSQILFYCNQGFFIAGIFTVILSSRIFKLVVTLNECQEVSSPHARVTARGQTRSRYAARCRAPPSCLTLAAQVSWRVSHNCSTANPGELKCQSALSYRFCNLQLVSCYVYNCNRL